MGRLSKVLTALRAAWVPDIAFRLDPQVKPKDDVRASLKTPEFRDEIIKVLLQA
jgi:hypothetical protein